MVILEMASLFRGEFLLSSFCLFRTASYVGEKRVADDVINVFSFEYVYAEFFPIVGQRQVGRKDFPK